jgi:hypothetical protein
MHLTNQIGLLEAAKQASKVSSSMINSKSRISGRSMMCMQPLMSFDTFHIKAVPFMV